MGGGYHVVEKGYSSVHAVGLLAREKREEGRGGGGGEEMLAL